MRRWLARELGGLRGPIAVSAGRCGAERYRKHFTAFMHACLLLFHGLGGGASLRQSYGAFAECAGLVALSGLGGPTEGTLSVSFSQFAASNTSRPAAFLGGLVAGLIGRVRRGSRGPAGAVPAEVHVQDSTFLRLSLKLAPWLPGGPGQEVPGVRVHLGYQPAWDLPEHVLLSDTRTTDGKALDAGLLDDPARLAALAGQTLLIDLGYYSHVRLARLAAAGVHVVTRRHRQAHVAVEAELPVQQPLAALGAGRIALTHDQRVSVGSPSNKESTLLVGWRLVSATVAPTPAAARRGDQPVVYEILTDRWDLSALEVVQLYLWRWQIELFLRWLKSHLHLPRLLGYSRNAIELSVWLALIVHLLTLLAVDALGLPRRTPTLRHQIRVALEHLSAAELSAPAATAEQWPFPGWGPGPPAPEPCPTTPFGGRPLR